MSVGSFVTTKRHEPTTLALPIEVPELKCDTCKAKDATALCMGCYGSFCFDCFTKHRQKVSRDFGNLLWEHELFEALFKPYSAQTATVTTTTTSATASARKFDPLSVLAQIDSWEQDLESRIKTMAAAARQNVKSSIDERHDAIFWHYPKITDDLRTIQQAKRYVDRERSSIKETLCDINNNIESSSNTPSLCFRSEKIDLTKTMKLVSTRSGTERRPSTAAVASSSSSSDIARQPLEFANLSQPNEPFEKVERLGGGTAIGASDKFIIYTDIDEKLEKCDLCMIELSNKYRVVIPLAGVVDICWCAEADYFVILTKREVYTFNPNRKQLDPVYEIQPPNKTQFRRCTYAGNTNTLFVSYRSDGSPIEEWKLSIKPVRRSLWEVPDSCRESESIQCIRISSGGNHIALTVNNGEEDYFVIRDRKMTQIYRMPLRVIDCLSFVSLPNNTWLLSVVNFHHLFLIRGNSNYDLFKLKQTRAGKSTTKGVAMVGDNIVAQRTASTILLFKL